MSNEESQNKLHDEPGRLRALQRYDVERRRDPDFESVTALVREVLAVEICTVTLVHSEQAWIMAAAGLESGGEVPREESFCHHAIQRSGPMVVPDARLDPRFADNDAVTGAPFVRSYAGFPLLSPDGYQIGALCVTDSRARRFAPSDLALLGRFAQLVVDQMEMRMLAHRDFLTDALTRRAFADGARSNFARSVRDRKAGALIMLDIDHFKSVNDRFGHATGDRVLRKVSDACRLALRPTDLFGRLGGEEFAVLAQDVSDGEAMALAERLRQAIEGMDARDCPAVTASFGVAPLRPGTDLDLAMAEADAALYAAKHRGRNRCVSSSSTLGLAA